MKCRWVAASLAGAMIAMPCASWAQQQPLRQAPATKAKQKAQPQPADLDVEELTPSQIRRAQVPELPPGTKGATKAAPKDPAKEGAKPPAPAAARVVTCSGAFAKDSSHVKLAMIYNTSNVLFTEVDGPENSKLMATVLFPKDPKRRLEVWWLNEAARSSTYLIVINGQSTWSAPKGAEARSAGCRAGKTQWQAVQAEGLWQGQFRHDHGLGWRRAGSSSGRLQGGCHAHVRCQSTAGGARRRGRHWGLRLDRRQSARGEARRRRDHPRILGRRSGYQLISL